MVYIVSGISFYLYFLSLLLHRRLFPTIKIVMFDYLSFLICCCVFFLACLLLYLCSKILYSKLFIIILRYNRVDVKPTTTATQDYTD